MSHLTQHVSRIIHRRSQQRRGAIAMLMAVFLPVLLVIIAMAVNIAYMHLARAELRIATDSAARAAGRTLSLTQSTAKARAAAIAAAAKNSVAGQPLRLTSRDVEFGMNSRPSPTSPWLFTANGGIGTVNAVQITGRKTNGSPSNPVSLFFTGVTSRTFFEPVRSSVAMQIDRDIILVVDRSGSMTSAMDRRTRAVVKWHRVRTRQRTRRRTAECISGTKWNALADAVDAFLLALQQTVPDEQVGLASFDHTASRDVEMTFDYTKIHDAMVAHTNNLSAGGTNIPRGLGKGIDQVLNEFNARPYAMKTIIVMTDGVGGNPVNAAKEAFDEHHIMMHSITFGRRANTRLMKRMAEVTGGKHWHANDMTDLVEAYVEIAKDIPTVLTH